MEISRCVWMRRVGMASANSLLRMTFFSPNSASIPPLSYSSLNQPYPPLNLISYRRSLCTPTHSSSSPIFSTSDKGKLLLTYLHKYVCMYVSLVVRIVLVVYWLLELFYTGCDDKSGYPMKGSRVLLKGMRYAELEVCIWVFFFLLNLPFYCLFKIWI